jgi:hypothetical protein
VTWLGTPSNSPFWYKLLDQLARKATGLQQLYVNWDSEVSWWHFGAGKDLRFVRELAKFQGLQSLVINGDYAKHWPSYLTEKTGVRVQEVDQDSSFLREYRRKYQRGTENLIP